MVIRLQSPLSKVGVFVFSVAIASSLVVHIGRRAYVQWCLQRPDKKALNEAIALDPEECSAYFRLGVYYTLDLRDLDPSRGEELLRRALRCQPLHATYWLALATALQASGRTDESIAAAEKAGALDSHNSLNLWRVGNLLLMVGKTEEAFDMFHRALEGTPGYAQRIFTLCWKASDNKEEILRRAVPDTADLDLAYLDFLASADQSKPDKSKLLEASKAWDRLIALGQPFRPEKSFRYLDALLTSAKTDEAVRDWNQMVSAGVLPRDELRLEDDLIVNGGFEIRPLNGGFDWRFYPLAGVVVGTDARVRHRGTRSLVIHFEGLSNLDFRHVLQMVPVQHNTDYHFRAFMKSRALSTRSGPHFEIFDPENPKKYHWETDDVLSTTEWSEYPLPIRTGPKTQLLIVVLNRRPAVELDKRIQGTLWVDDVQLVPKNLDQE